MAPAKQLFDHLLDPKNSAKCDRTRFSANSKRLSLFFGQRNADWGSAARTVTDPGFEGAVGGFLMHS